MNIRAPMFWTALLEEATNDVDDDACSPSHDYGPELSRV